MKTDRKNWNKEKTYYVDAINELMAECTDVELLYLIKSILLHSKREEEVK